jgi:hypothetical protein
MRRPRLRQTVLLVGLAGGAAALVAAACGQPYSASPEPSVPDAGGDADPAADAGGDAAPADPCEHARAPSPPAVDDAPDTELPPFFVALRQVTIANKQDQIVGYDLDGVCTCDTRASTAHAGQPSCAAATAACDVEGGVDNAASVLLAQSSPFFSFDLATQSLVASGRRTLLVQIAKYNGKPNDKAVAFAVTLSDGIREKVCPTSGVDPNYGTWTPGWCADDKWSLPSDAVLPTTKQPLLQGVGFVRDGVLSLQIPSGLQLPFTSAASLPIGGAVMTGRLVPLGEDLLPRDRTRAPTAREQRLYALDNGVVGGRIKAVELLAAIGTVEQVLDGDAGNVQLCNVPFFGLVRDSLCGAVDIASAPSLDFAPSGACDALSIGFAFTAFPALVGDVRVGTPDVNPCAAGPDGQPSDAGADPPYRCK